MNADYSVDTLTSKRLLVSDLKNMLTLKLAFGDVIERKATELFKFSSVTLGIVGVVGLTRADIRNNWVLAGSYILLLITYIYHAYCMYRVIRPSVYSVVPGIPNAIISYDDFYTSYVAQGEEGYLSQTISDLAGTDDDAGALRDSEVVNVEKAKHLKRLGASFVVMTTIVLLMGAISVAF